MDDTVQSKFTQGYVHWARVRCWSCVGTGVVDTYTCGICEGEGAIQKGCHGASEKDEHYGLSYCISEGRVVPSEELSKS